MQSFRKEFGEAVDMPINAICYDLTDGGDLVRGKPHTWEALKSHVWDRVRHYDDLKHYTQKQVDDGVAYWLEWNEKKFEGVSAFHFPSLP